MDAVKGTTMSAVVFSNLGHRNGIRIERTAECQVAENAVPWREGQKPRSALALGKSLPQNGTRRAGENAMKIEIFDQSYNVQAEGEESYLRELASFVDEKMHAVAESTHQVDSTRVAVLTALNIADELFVLRKRLKQIEGPVRQRVERCVRLVEKTLAASA